MSTPQFETIRTEGGILSTEYLHDVARQNAPAQSVADYGVPVGLTLRDEIIRSWKIARALRREKLTGKIKGCEFAQQFLQQALGFDDLRQCAPPTAAHRADGDIRAPTHLAKSGEVSVVIAPTDEGLDKRQEGLLPDRKISPFELAQIHLNSDERHLWGIACDGNTLRVLRDADSMTRAAYLEADLQCMLEEGGEVHRGEFSLLYLVAHASRFCPAATCPLERWREKSVQTGIRAHKQLRIGVERALIALGDGFLRHPANKALRDNIGQNGEINEYHNELLGLAYRLIFLLVTEDRGLLQRPDADAAQKSAYQNGYGVSRLRARAARPGIAADNHDDLWEGLKHAFAAMQGDGSGGGHLGLPALGGLFAEDRCPRSQQSRLANSYLLLAMSHLSYIRDENRRTRVNYRDMGADELGSIYESLLELTPRRDMEGRFGFFNPADSEGGGNTRRTSGSYYTAPALVEELINSALRPALDAARDEDALLSLRVLDPACGSGHFLLAAARRIAAKLIKIREEKGDDDGEVLHRRRLAMREVISRCICGVDKNPMALDLAKTALWLEAFDAEKPLIFLDHHLQCGDSLLGVLDLDSLRGGIPDAAYAPATGDDKPFCATLKKENKKEREHKTAALFADARGQLADEAARIESMPEDDLLQVADKRKAHRQLEQKRADTGEHIAADMFSAAFLTRKQPAAPSPPTSSDIFGVLGGSVAHNEQTAAAARRCAAKNLAFHWWLRYPAVKAKGGFDVVLANPPWERIKLQELEFFARRAPHIANAANQSERRKMIAALGKEERDEHGRALIKEYVAAKHATETASNYIRNGGNFPLTGKGDINTYPLFAELCLRLSPNGAAGIIVPSGIATDDNTKTYFNYLIENKRLRSLYDFENRKGLFPDVHPSFRLSLLTIAASEESDFVVFAHGVADLRDEHRRITLTPAQLRLVNPNTCTMPLYRTRHDCELCEKLYRAAPVLWRQDAETEDNPWQIRFQRIFDMAGDSKLFKKEPGTGLTRLYEAKYMHQYDHRWKTREKNGKDREVWQEEKQNPDFAVATRYYVDENIVLARVANIPAELRRTVEKDGADFWDIAQNWLAGHFILRMQSPAPLLKECSAAYADCRRQVDINKAREYAMQSPLPEEKIKALAAARDMTDFLRQCAPTWLMGWRDITAATNQLTLVSSILPLAGIGHNVLTLHSGLSADKKAILQAMLSSLIIDYVARQKIAGLHFNYPYMRQLPILPPDAFTAEDMRAIVPAVLELTYTAHDMRPFYDDIMRQNPNYDPRPAAEHGTPFAWDEERRAILRAQLDARIAQKYGITRDELRYILDPAEVMGDDYPSETFRVLKEKEIAKHGEYRTRRLVLEEYDKLTKQ